MACSRVTFTSTFIMDVQNFNKVSIVEIHDS